MVSPLLRIIRKEVIEMVRDPRLLLGMIIVPLLIFPLMGFAMSSSVSSVQDSVEFVEIGIVNFDHGHRADQLIDHLSNRSIIPHSYEKEELDRMKNGTEFPVNLFLVIPSNFTVNIDDNRSSTVSIYTSLKTYSMTESIPTELIAGYVLEFQQSILEERIAAGYPGHEVANITYPVMLESRSIIKGVDQPVSPVEVTNQMMSQSLMIPMVLMILLIMAAQLAATSVAMEKEEKTLETLLTTPVSRGSILLGKIVGVVVISAIALVAYVFGFSFYISSINSMASEGMASVDLASLGLVPSSSGMLLLFVSLFLSLVSALSLSVLVASFTEDVRSAQSLLGVLYVPIFIPALVLMFIDVSQLPGVAQTVILAIPFTYPILAAKAMYTGDFALVLIGILYQVVFTAVIIYIASRSFSSEKILTARLNLKMRGALLSFKRK